MYEDVEMDRRQKRTKDAIYKAFISLLLEEDYGNISVKDIIGRANVGRSTFYCHYETKEQLLSSLCSDYFNNIFPEKVELLMSRETLYEKLYQIFRQLEKSKKEICPLLSSGNADLLLKNLKEKFHSFFRMNAYRKDVKFPEGFLEYYFGGSLSQTIIWWAKEGMVTSPEEMANYFIEALAPLQ